MTWLNNLGGLVDKEILAVGTCGPGEVEGVFDGRFEVTRIRHLQREPRFFKDVIALINLSFLIRKVRPSIVNTHTLKAGVLGRLAVVLSGLRNRTKVVHTFHGHHHYGYFGSATVNIISRIERILERITDCYIINGRQVESDLLSSGLFKSKRHVVILPGVQDQQKRIKRSSDGELKVGWLGRFTEIKRPKMFLEIARELPNFEFHIGGAGELEPELRESAPANVIFHGWVIPQKFWSGLDIATLTSYNEAAPFSLIEAATMGLPCIATDVGSVSDIVTDGVNGFLIHGGVEEFVNRIIELSLDSELRENMGLISFEKSKKSFALDNFRVAHIDIYNDLLK